VWLVENNTAQLTMKKQTNSSGKSRDTKSNARKKNTESTGDFRAISINRHNFHLFKAIELQKSITERKTNQKMWHYQFSTEHPPHKRIGVVPTS